MLFANICMTMRRPVSSTTVYHAVLITVLAAATALFAELKEGLLFGTLASQPAMATAIAIFLSVAGIWLSAAQFTPAGRIIYRTTVLLFGFYLIAAYVPIPPGSSNAAAAWLSYGPPFGAAAAVIAWWRPSFALTTFTCLVLDKRIAAELWETQITPTDWLPVMESSTFLVLAMAVLALLARVPALSKHIENKVSGGSVLPLGDAVVVVTIGIHLANYLWSGLAKLVLDGGPLSWVTENRTDVLLDVAWEFGFLPISQWPQLSGAVHAGLAEGVVFLNLVTLAAQLVCVLAFWRRWAIAALTVFYDLQHLAIFATTGIFFWKWILLNAAIIAAAWRLRTPKIPFTVGLLGLAACTFARGLFFIAELGWYDTRSANRIYATAVTNSGVELEVPTNFFTALSVVMAQMDYAKAASGAFPTGTWGTTLRRTVMIQGMACQLAAEQPASSQFDEARLRRLISNFHAVALSRVDSTGKLNYDLYPHHIWSNPFAFDAFRELDKRSVVAYRWTLESVCLDRLDRYGGRKVVSRRSFVVNVR